MNSHAANGHFRKILVGYDGSPEAEKALGVALAMAAVMGAKVAVLAVAQPSEPAIAVESQGILDNAHETYDESLRRIADAGSQNGIQVETAIAVGNPADQIIRQAERDNSDLIIVGQRGRSTLAKLVMGSVSELVLQHAPCPVMVTR